VFLRFIFSFPEVFLLDKIQRLFGKAKIRTNLEAKDWRREVEKEKISCFGVGFLFIIENNKLSF